MGENLLNKRQAFPHDYGFNFDHIRGLNIPIEKVENTDLHLEEIVLLVPSGAVVLGEEEKIITGVLGLFVCYLSGIVDELFAEENKEELVQKRYYNKKKNL